MQFVQHIRWTVYWCMYYVCMQVCSWKCLHVLYVSICGTVLLVVNYKIKVKIASSRLCQLYILSIHQLNIRVYVYVYIFFSENIRPLQRVACCPHAPVYQRVWLAVGGENSCGRGKVSSVFLLTEGRRTVAIELSLWDWQCFPSAAVLEKFLLAVKASTLRADALGNRVLL